MATDGRVGPTVGTPRRMSIEYLWSETVMIARAAARKQGWQDRGRATWIKRDGIEVSYIGLVEQLAIVEPGMTVHVVGKVPRDLRRPKGVKVIALTASADP